MPVARQTPKRSIRIPEPLWRRALDRAEERGEPLSEVIRRKLEEYAPEPRS